MNYQEPQQSQLWTWRNHEGTVLQSSTVVVPPQDERQFLADRNISPSQIIKKEIITPTWDEKTRTFIHKNIFHHSLNQTH